MVLILQKLNYRASIDASLNVEKNIKNKNIHLNVIGLVAAITYHKPHNHFITQIVLNYILYVGYMFVLKIIEVL